MKHIQRLMEDPENFEPAETSRQRHTYEGKSWYVDNLISLSADLPRFRLPIKDLRAIELKSKFPTVGKGDYLEIAYHARVAMAADLQYPIILGEDGRIMDGHHRVLKALITGEPDILVVQFTIDPLPDVEEPEEK